MKKSKEIIGLPVISISDGVQVGDVKGMVVNPGQKNIEFLLIDENGGSASQLRGFSYLSAEGVGDFAVTIDSSCGIIDILKVNVLKELASENVIGTQVVTKKGKLAGKVTEYLVDPEDGNIKEFYFRGEGDKSDKTVTIDKVITVGKEALIIDDTALDSKAQNFKEGDERAAEVIEEVAEEDTAEEILEETIDDAEEEEETEVPEASVTSDDQDPAAKTADDARTELRKPKKEEATVSKLVQQQKQYILGKTLIRDIKSDDGTVLAGENEKVNEEVFMKLYEAGPQKIVEAMTYVKD